METTQSQETGGVAAATETKTKPEEAFDRLIGKSLEEAKTMAYVCMKISQMSPSLGEQIEAMLGENIEAYRRDEFPKDFDTEIDILPITRWLNVLNAAEIMRGRTPINKPPTAEGPAVKETPAKKTLSTGNPVIDKYVEEMGVMFAVAVKFHEMVGRMDRQAATNMSEMLEPRLEVLYEDHPQEVGETVQANLRELLGVAHGMEVVLMSE